MQMWEQLQAATRNAFTGGVAGPSGPGPSGPGPSSDAEPTASPRGASAAKKRKKGK
jgi:hypothetical protein